MLAAAANRVRRGVARLCMRCREVVAALPAGTHPTVVLPEPCFPCHLLWSSQLHNYSHPEKTLVLLAGIIFEYCKIFALVRPQLCRCVSKFMEVAPTAPPGLFYVVSSLTTVCLCDCSFPTGGQGVWPVYQRTDKHAAHKPRGHDLNRDLIFSASICCSVQTITGKLAGEFSPYEEVKKKQRKTMNALFRQLIKY